MRNSIHLTNALYRDVGLTGKNTLHMFMQLEALDISRDNSRFAHHNM